MKNEGCQKIGDRMDGSITDVLILGTGLGGLASALFAAGTGLKVMVAGETSGCRYMSGLFDFLDNLSGFSDDPCAGFDVLPRNHPFRKFSPEEISLALSLVMKFLSDNNLLYESAINKNSLVITSAGSLKMTYGYPLTMRHGIEAVKNGWPVLIAEFEGIKGFSSLQIAQGLSGFCKAHTIKIPFPCVSGSQELTPEAAARSLDLPENRIRLAHALLPHVKNAKAVGLPPVLGIYDSDGVLEDLANILGIGVFEIPGLTPSVPGLRFEEKMITALLKLGVRFFRNKRVARMTSCGGGFQAEIENFSGTETIRSRSVIMATGRFFGKGLVAGINGVSEPLLGLPVLQPATRESWHSRLYFDPCGHELNRSGIETDEFLRPVCAKGVPIFKNLHVAGTMLSGHDWTREKCGASLSFASAWKAVKSLKMSLDEENGSSKAKHKESTGDHHGNFIFSEAV